MFLAAIYIKIYNLCKCQLFSKLSWKIRESLDGKGKRSWEAQETDKLVGWERGHRTLEGARCNQQKSRAQRRDGAGLD